MSKIGEQIKELREKGYTYPQIEEELGVYRSMVSYWCQKFKIGIENRVVKEKKEVKIRSLETNNKKAHYYRAKKCVSKICTNIKCGKTYLVEKYVADNSKYCSGSCRNIVKNQNPTGNRSKCEFELQKRLLKEYPTESFIWNDRVVLEGKEMDLYIPQLKVGVEWNGIYHYKNVHNDGSFERCQQTDNLKVKIAQQKGIRLIIVKDMLSSSKNIQRLIDCIVDLLHNIEDLEGSVSIY